MRHQDDPDAPPANWAARPDIFSTYKSGFEIRTARLCRGIYLRHCFADENNGLPFTTRALLPEYESSGLADISMLKRVCSRGYRLRGNQPLWIADTPATELTYQAFSPLEAKWQLLEAEAPGYLDANGFLPVDLDGIGIDGLLYTTGSFTGYLEPLGNGRYAPMRVLHDFPVLRDLQPGRVNLTSLNGNNALDLVVSIGGSNGFFSRENNTRWQPFRPFDSFPVEYLSPEKEMADLSGTGRNDLLFSAGSQLKFYASEGQAGFAAASHAFTPPGFPETVPGGTAQLYGFSDFLGDGLSHRFCLRNGSLTIWPCLGHGSFGKAVVMNHAPVVY